MKNILTALAVLSCCWVLQFCASSKNAMSGKHGKQPVPVSYATDVAPIIHTHCSPCHFPDGGKKKFLDTKDAVMDNFADILYRVQLPQDSARFMPFKLKKPPLTDSLIQVLKLWQAGGMQG